MSEKVMTLNSIIVNTLIVLFTRITLLPAVTLNKDKENASVMETQADQSPIKQAVLVYKSGLQSLPLAAQ